MTKLTFVAAALVAASAYTSQASANRGNEHTRATAATSNIDCVRAPNLGAFAGAPYTTPPCMPNPAN
jgi:hypothetical protein